MCFFLRQNRKKLQDCKQSLAFKKYIKLKEAQQSGMTLIEIMIALILSLFLIGGVMQLFIKSKETYLVQDALARLQENGRFALDFLAKDIRMADYRSWGCDSTVYTYVAPNTPLTGTNNDGVAPTPNDVLVLDGTDTISVRWVGLNPAPPPVCGPLVGASYRITTAGNLNNGVNDIVDNVENMQIVYGVDSDLVPDGVANYYLEGGAANFPDAVAWARVVSVRISLLLRSDDNVTSGRIPYNYNGQTNIVPNDRRLRRVFTSTIALRNRIR